MQHTLRSKLAKIVGALALICALACAIAPKVSAQTDQSFDLHNNSAKIMSYVYLVQTTGNGWEEDVLGEDNGIQPGETQHIPVDGSYKDRLWRMKVVYEDGKTGVWRDINLTKITTITINYKNGQFSMSKKYID
jgi:hypothetical protein